MEKCQFASTAKGTTCPGCGYALRRDYPSIPHRICEPPRRLGDLVEKALRDVGITEESYRAAKAIVGRPPTCKCKDRKAWLNALDAELGLGERLADVLAILKW